MNERKKSKLIRSGYYVFSGRGEFLNCLCCSALALLLHSTVIWPIQFPTRTEKGFAEFLNQKRSHPRSILGAKRGKWGQAVSVALGQSRASGLGEPPGAPSALQ